MTMLSQASMQWMKRPHDERYDSIEALHDAAMTARRGSAKATVQIAKLKAAVLGDEVILNGERDTTAHMTNWAFGQIARAAGAPPSYLRTLPATLAADCLNNGLRKAEGESSLLLDRTGGELTLRAATSDSYARIWNSEISARLLELQANGPWQPAPAGFDGSRGLYLGDRDMFCFLVDSDRRIFEKAPGGGLSRGFFVSNSEVGAASFTLTSFLYAYICGNHCVWSAQNVAELSLRHVGDANARAFGELSVRLKQYSDASAGDDEAKITQAKAYELGKTKQEVLDRIFGMRNATLTRKVITAAYDLVDTKRADWYGSPRTVWGIGNGLTEIARDLPNADDRTALDRAAGKVFEIAF